VFSVESKIDEITYMLQSYVSKYINKKK